MLMYLFATGGNKFIQKIKIQHTVSMLGLIYFILLTTLSITFGEICIARTRCLPL